METSDSELGFLCASTGNLELSRSVSSSASLSGVAVENVQALEYIAALEKTGRLEDVEALLFDGESAWFAATTESGERVVLKRVNGEVVENVAEVVEKMAELKNDRLVQYCREYFEAKGSVFLVERAVDGKTVDQCLAQGNYFDEIDLINAAKDVLTALSFLHGKGLFHGRLSTASLVHTVRFDIVVAEFAVSAVVKQKRPLAEMIKKDLADLKTCLMTMGQGTLPEGLAEVLDRDDPIEEMLADKIFAEDEEDEDDSYYSENEEDYEEEETHYKASFEEIEVLRSDSFCEVVHTRKQNDDNHYIVKKVKFHPRALTVMDNDYVVRYYDMWHEDGINYISMEYCEGSTLRNEIDQLPRSVSARVNSEKLRGLFRNICEGVEYIHSLGICHGNIKPQNVYITKEYTPKIGGFYLWDEVMVPESWSPYVAPEVVSGRERRLTSMADIYSLGMLLVEMFCPVNAGDLLKAKKRQFPRDFEENAKEEMELVKKMMDDNPNVRPNISAVLGDKLFPATLEEKLKRQIIDTAGTSGTMLNEFALKTLFRTKAEMRKSGAPAKHTAKNMPVHTARATRYVVDALASVFSVHSATRVRTSLLMSEKPAVARSVQLLEHDGRVAYARRDLLESFQETVSERAASEFLVKRFEIGDVWDPEKPKLRTHAQFSIVSNQITKSVADMELYALALPLLEVFAGTDSLVLRFNHTSLLSLVLDHSDIDTNKKDKFVEILKTGKSDHEINKEMARNNIAIKYMQFIKKLKNAFCDFPLESLLKGSVPPTLPEWCLCQTVKDVVNEVAAVCACLKECSPKYEKLLERVVIDPTLIPNNKFDGLFFAVSPGSTKLSSPQFFWGGSIALKFSRYISAAVFDVKNIAQHVMRKQKDLSVTRVSYVSPCEVFVVATTTRAGAFPTSDVLSVATTLWDNNIPADIFPVVCERSQIDTILGTTKVKWVARVDPREVGCKLISKSSASESVSMDTICQTIRGGSESLSSSDLLSSISRERTEVERKSSSSKQNQFEYVSLTQKALAMDQIKEHMEREYGSRFAANAGIPVLVGAIPKQYLDDMARNLAGCEQEWRTQGESPKAVVECMELIRDKYLNRPIVIVLNHSKIESACVFPAFALQSSLGKSKR